MASITSANAVFMLSITGLFPTPVQLKGFSADDIYSVDAIDPVVTSMGVDGFLSGGMTFKEVKQSIMLQSDSASNAIFDTWQNNQLNAVDVFVANAVVTLKSLGTEWIMTRGFLTSFPPLPDAGQTLKPRKYQITWNSVFPNVL